MTTRFQKQLDIYQRILNGETYQSIADDYGVTRQWIGFFAKQQGIVPEDTRRKRTTKADLIPSELRLKAHMLYHAGFSIAFIQKHLGKTTTQWEKLLKGSPRLGRIKPEKHWFQLRAIYRDLDSGMTWMFLGEKYGFHIPYVARLIKRRDLYEHALLVLDELGIEIEP